MDICDFLRAKARQCRALAALYEGEAASMLAAIAADLDARADAMEARLAALLPRRSGGRRAGRLN